MSDRELRDRERRFLESGDPADELPWLRLRVRRGLTTTRGLKLAAYLGHEPARRLLIEETDLALPPQIAAVRHWVHAMPGFTVEAFPWLVHQAQRVGAALHRLAAELLEKYEVKNASLASQHMQRWIAEGVESDRESAYDLSNACAEDGLRRSWLWNVSHRRQRQAIDALWRCSWVAHWHDLHVNAGPATAADLLSRLTGEATVRRTLAEDVVPWALDYWDPVLQRVQNQPS